MTIESFQDTLFEDPVGLRFRHTREKQKLTREQVAQQLKLPVAVLDAIECEDWARLGAPIFVRSYLGSYARLLGLPASLADEAVRGKPAPQLAPIGSVAPVAGAFDRSVMNLAYLAMTVVIVGSVVMLALYFQGPRRTSEVLPADSPATYATAQASLAPPMPTIPTIATPAAAEPALVLNFRAASWLDVKGRDGSTVDSEVVGAGAQKTFPAAGIGQVTLGDASAVDATFAGIAVDLTPYREAKIARFTVSSDGELMPVPGKQAQP